MNIAYLLLGSNIGDRMENLQQAIEQITMNAGIVVLASSLYETEPWGTNVPATYYNRVIKIETELAANKLLEVLLSIEKQMGRERGDFRNLPRTMDIDILFFNNDIIADKNLIIPHERLHLRRFVLVPLAEIATEIVHPVLQKTIKELLDSCTDKLWVRLV